MYDSAWSAGIFSGVLVAVVFLAVTLLSKPTKCEACGTAQPKVRLPKTMTQALWGGHTCKGCGAEINGLGIVRQK